MSLLDRLRQPLLDRLPGWSVRELRTFRTLTLTRSTVDGALAAAELTQTGPSSVHARAGVGHERALELMPLLTLRPEAILVPTGERTDTAEPDALAAWILERAPEPRTPPPGSVEDEQLRLVLLLALGELEQARALLPAFEEEDPRFARQVRRRLDGGLPPAPPVEETMAVLQPDRPPLPPVRELLALGRDRARAQKEALDAARAATGDLAEAVAAEHRARGLEITPSEVLLTADMLRRERRPFGRVRGSARTAGLLGSSALHVARLFRGGAPPDPEWLRQPEAAAYPVPPGSSRWIAVDVEDPARTWVETAGRQAGRRVGPWALVAARLTLDAGRVTVHFGRHPVGTADAGPFATAFAAAALLAEDPVTDARIALGAIEIEAPPA